MATLSYYVAPRYTSGSPALVDKRIADSVAREERRAFARYVMGAYGMEGERRAERDGLSGVVERRISDGFAGGLAGSWLCEDMITGRIYRRLVGLKATKLAVGDVITRVEVGQYTGRRLDDSPPWTVRTVEVVKHAGTSTVIINVEGDDRIAISSNTRLTVEREKEGE